MLLLFCLSVTTNTPSFALEADYNNITIIGSFEIWNKLDTPEKIQMLEILLHHKRTDVIYRLLQDYSLPEKEWFLKKQFYMAEVHKSRGDFKKAIKAYKIILQHDPDFIRSRVELANILTRLDKNDHARIQNEIIRNSSAKKKLEKLQRKMPAPIAVSKKTQKQGSHEEAHILNNNRLGITGKQELAILKEIWGDDNNYRLKLSDKLRLPTDIREQK